MTLPVDPRVVDNFFAGVDDAVQRGSIQVHVAHRDVLVIARDPAHRAAFRRFFKGLSDPSVREAILDYLGDVARKQKKASRAAEITVDLVDRAGMAPAAGLTVAGVGAVATGGVLAPFLLAGGLVSLIASGIGRTLLKRSAQVSEDSAEDVKQFLESLKQLESSK